MVVTQNNNGHKVIPELPLKQKESYKRMKKWPPEEGITILVEEKPSRNAVLRLLDILSKVVKPSQQKYIDQAKETLAER